MRHKRFSLLNPTKSVRSNLTGLKLCAVLLLGLGLTGLQAQESLNTSGGKATGSGGSVSYSVGQLVYTTNTGTNGTVAEGVQQAYEISIVTGIEEAKAITLTVLAYPNPTSDYLTLSISEFDNSDLSYQLYDITGKTILTESIAGELTTIPMGNLISGTYFVRVNQSQSEVHRVKSNHAAAKQLNLVKTFKIIKQ